MKELSIEEKAKRYDKALTKARNIVNSINVGLIGKDSFEVVFPELKKYEDEKLRKAAIQFIRLNKPFGYYIDGISREEVLAWLENQDIFSKKDIDDAYLEGITNAKKEIEKQYEANYQIRKDIATFIFNYRGDIKDRAKWIDYLGIKVSFVEKHGEHTKFINSIQVGDKVTRNQDGMLVNLSQLERMAKLAKSEEHDVCDYCDQQGSCIDHCCIKLIEKQDKQKSADKVEPKFKVGDWIISNNAGNPPLRITDINDKYYIFSERDSIIRIEDCDEYYHLWTIQDAKDGDVLCTYECNEPKIVFVLKGTPKKHYALSYYCYYNIMYSHFDSDSEKGCLSPNDNDLKPATEEQRNIIMNAIAYEGYTFDFEKKELKKIEQKPAWSEKYIANVFEKVGLAKIAREQGNDALTGALQSAMIELSKFIPQPNQEWSEEDEEIKSALISLCLASAPESWAKYADWFNSIKDRIQPRQKWSEEDGMHLTNAILAAEKEWGIESYTSKWLKSLKDRIQLQSKCEWSEEDEKIISDAEVWLDTLCDYLKNSSSAYISNVRVIISKLKSFKDRVFPQLKQEWIEEDDKGYEEVMWCICEAENQAETENDKQSAKNAENWINNRLKFLRPQNWTKEDKERYISCLQRLGTGNPEQPETVNSKWFKEHVYSQSTWKPSEEQIMYISEAIDIADGASKYSVVTALKEIREQLKKLREGQL